MGILEKATGLFSKAKEGGKAIGGKVHDGISDFGQFLIDTTEGAVGEKAVDDFFAFLNGGDDDTAPKKKTPAKKESKVEEVTLHENDENAGNDVIHGTSKDDYLYGGEGDDVVQGMGGRDLMFGDDGYDTLDVSEWDGFYQLDMNTGKTNFAREEAHDFEAVIMGDGVNIITGTWEDNEMELNGGNDVAFGGRGDDELYGGDGNDSLYGEDHNDMLFGGAGHDVLIGGDGNDVIQGGAGRDFMDGGDGVDTLIVTEWDGAFHLNMNTGATNWAGETATGFENVMLGDGKNIVTGTDDDNLISTAGGDDYLIGGKGMDFLIGGDGSDVLIGGADSDMFVFSANETGFDTIRDFKKGEDIMVFLDQQDMGELMISGYQGGTLIDYGAGHVHVTGLKITDVDTSIFEFGG